MRILAWLNTRNPYRIVARQSIRALYAILASMYTTLTPLNNETVSQGELRRSLRTLLRFTQSEIDKIEELLPDEVREIREKMVVPDPEATRDQYIGSESDSDES